MSDPTTPGPFIRREAIERASGMITYVITTWYKAHRHLVKVNLFLAISYLLEGINQL